MDIVSPHRSTLARSGRLVSFLITLALALGAGSAQTFDVRTRTVTVAPNGSDDTLALRQAFATCVNVGPGCTVRLAEGTFHTRQHVIEGFRGTFVGAGTERTVIMPLTPMRVTAAEMVIMNPPTHEEPWPTLFLFIDAHMTMADMTLRVTDYEVTTPWNIYGMELTALATFVSLTGDDVRVDVMRVAMESGEGTFFGVNVINGLFIQGVWPGPSGGFADRPPFTGTVTVRDSRFLGSDGGVSIGNVEGSTVSIRDSVFDGVFSVFMQDVSGSLIEIVDNDIATVDTGVWLAAGFDNPPTVPTRVVVAGNTVRVPEGAQGVVIADFGDLPTLRVLVDGNVFELDGALAGVGGFAHGAVVRDNLMRGSAAAGVRVGAVPPEDDEEPSPAAVGWVLAGNDFGELGVEVARVWLTADAHDVVVVCGRSTGVVDEGVRSQVLCD